MSSDDGICEVHRYFEYFPERLQKIELCFLNTYGYEINELVDDIEEGRGSVTKKKALSDHDPLLQISLLYAEASTLLDLLYSYYVSFEDDLIDKAPVVAMRYADTCSLLNDLLANPEKTKYEKIGELQIEVLSRANEERAKDSQEFAAFAHRELARKSPGKGEKLQAIREIAADITRREKMKNPNSKGISARGLYNAMRRYPQEDCTGGPHM